MQWQGVVVLCHFWNFNISTAGMPFHVSLTFLSRTSSPSPSSMAFCGMCEWLPHVFCCNSPLLLVSWWGSWWLFSVATWTLCWLLLTSQGLVLAGHVSTSLALPLGRTMVPGWLPLNPCEGGEYSSPCCYNWALCWVPQSPLHLLPFAKASRALAVAQWSYCPNPETFLASTLSGSSRCWDFSDS